MERALRDYLVVTAGYWAFTITDGALRMLVVLHFHLLGYAPFEVAMPDVPRAWPCSASWPCPPP
jgi:hypothetical protein